MSEDEWRSRRSEAAAAQADRAARAKAAETVRARAVVAEFVVRAREQGLATSELLARAGDQSGTYRTGLVGWYLRRDGSLGVTTDGEWYVLVAPKSLRSRLAGVRLEASDPPLQVGAGARDGESIALTALVELRLAAGDDWELVR